MNFELQRWLSGTKITYFYSYSSFPFADHFLKNLTFILLASEVVKRDVRLSGFSGFGFSASY